MTAMPVDFESFDISEHLDSEEMIAGYLSAAAEDDDPNVLLGALAHAAKARGMMQVAKDAGLSRESLYKALKPGAHPRFETVQAVLRALGVKLVVGARGSASAPEAAPPTREVGQDVARAIADGLFSSFQHAKRK
jgi:probable addiction module antidote protein